MINLKANPTPKPEPTCFRFFLTLVKPLLSCFRQKPLSFLLGVGLPLMDRNGENAHTHAHNTHTEAHTHTNTRTHTHTVDFQSLRRGTHSKHTQRGVKKSGQLSIDTQQKSYPEKCRLLMLTFCSKSRACIKFVVLCFIWCQDKHFDLPGDKTSQNSITQLSTGQPKSNRPLPTSHGV